MLIQELHIFMNGHSNIYKYYASKNFKEYQKYGETSRGHEILLMITRDVVLMIFTLFFNVIDSVLSGVIFRMAVHRHASTSVIVGLNVSIAFIRVLDICGFVVASYFMYKFGYKDYRTFCTRCDRAVYRCCERKYHVQVTLDLCDRYVFSGTVLIEIRVNQNSSSLALFLKMWLANIALY